MWAVDQEHSSPAQHYTVNVWLSIEDVVSLDSTIPSCISFVIPILQKARISHVPLIIISRCMCVWGGGSRYGVGLGGSNLFKCHFEISAINSVSLSYLSKGSSFSDPCGQTEIACFISNMTEETTRNICPTLV